VLNSIQAACSGTRRHLPIPNRPGGVASALSSESHIGGQRRGRTESRTVSVAHDSPNDLDDVVTLIPSRKRESG